MPNILIAHEDGENLKITGMVDISDDLRELVGTETEAPEIVLEKSAGANLEEALVKGLRSAREVLGGYVKFAKPILLKGVVPAYVTEKLAKLASETTNTTVSIPTTTQGATPSLPKFEVDPAVQVELRHLIEKAAAGEFTKEAKVHASPFTQRLLARMEADKVDGTKIGLTMPCKIAFETPERRDWFLSLFEGLEGAEEKQASGFSIDELAGRLVDDGLVKGGVVERLASAGVKKHAKESTTRRKQAVK